MQQYADIYLLQSHSTCFGCPPRPSSGVPKTVTAASGTGHNIGAATSLCILLHLVGFLLILNYDARNHELKKHTNIFVVSQMESSVHIVNCVCVFYKNSVLNPGAFLFSRFN